MQVALFEKLQVLFSPVVVSSSSAVPGHPGTPITPFGPGPKPAGLEVSSVVQVMVPAIANVTVPSKKAVRTKAMMSPFFMPVPPLFWFVDERYDYIRQEYF
jgi:hypothetical protein